MVIQANLELISLDFYSLLCSEETNQATNTTSELETLQLATSPNTLVVIESAVEVHQLTT
ncbi:hypothetical protein IEQ34_018554 [Dendrobium chrysotoxum]|uniref:Uncharacterized protein n=1 Tax=Dendrobium chrysotoxum TaxID=161865 RepID=A0AAV7G523_DENCH|nr:hypothetical protein IEQ34_018554 [Dendrobium chrysotoxum]